MGNFFTKKKSSVKPRNNYEEFFLLNKPSAEDVDYERMHLSHNLTREIFEGNFSSPIRDILLDENTKILDIGCGAGYWLREMAADFQRPKFFGIDMLPIFSEYAFPNNTTFLQHDFLQGLPFEDGTFDFIHMQYLAWDFTELSWETFVYQELARVLKPGGWLEITDIDMEPVNAGPTIKLLIKSTSKAFVSKNVNLNIIQRYNSLVKSIPSFSSSSLNCESSSLPLGNWADRIGESGTLFVKETCKAFLQGQIGKDMKIKRKNVNSTLEEIVKEFESYRTSFNVHRFYVQKSL